MKVEHKSRDDARNHDTKRRRKHFQHIVRVLDYRGNDEATDGLYRDHRPNNARVASQETLLLDSSGIFEINCQVSNDNRRETHLNISNPERRSASLENFLCCGRVMMSEIETEDVAPHGQPTHNAIRTCASAISELDSTHRNKLH